MQESTRWADVISFPLFVRTVTTKIEPCTGGYTLIFTCPIPGDTDPDNVLYTSTNLLHEDKMFTSGIDFLLEVRRDNLARLYSMRVLADGTPDLSQSLSYQQCVEHRVPAIV